MIRIFLLFSFILTISTLNFVPSPYTRSHASVAAANALRWKLIHNGIFTTPTTLNCNWLLIGGYGIVSSSDTLERVYDNIPSHNFVYFGLTIFTLDDWQPSDSISVQVDGQTIATYYPKSYQGISSNICGNPSIVDTYTDIAGKFPHSASSMTLRIIGTSANSDATVASFGVNQLSFSFPSAVIADTTTVLLAPKNVIQYTAQGKTCNYWNYLAADGTCKPCATKCFYCWGPGTNQCYMPHTTYSFDGTNIIHNLINCRISPSSTQCDLCNSGQLLDLDGVCRNPCSNPVAFQKRVGAVGFCIDPCPAGQFMLWNMTCASACPFPLSRSVSPTQGGICNYPCSDGQYLYWNGSCLSTCDSPYKSRAEISPEFVPAVQFCNLPCQPYEYLFEDGSCQANCPKTMIMSIFETTLHLCNTPQLSSEEVKQVQQAADLAQQGGKVANGALKALNILSPSNPSSTTTGSLSRMFSYLRYLNISHSPKLEAFFQAQDFDTPDSIPFPTLSSDEKARYPNRSKPYMFEKYGLFSSFLANFGNEIISLTIYMGIMGFIWTLDWTCKFLRNLPILKKSAAKGKVAMQNYVISQFYGASGEIIFYATIELRTVILDSTYAFLSFFTCLVCLIVGCSFIFIHFWILYKYQEIKHNKNISKHALEKYKKKFQGMQLFFEDFKDATFGQQAFLFYSLLRNILFNLTVGLMFAYPLAQTIIIVLLDLLMIVYLGFKRPLKSNLELIQQICFELSIITATGSCLVMAFLDLSEGNHSSLIENSSQVIIYINIVFNFLPLVFLGLKIIAGCYELFHWIRKNYKKSNTLPLKTRTSTAFEDSQQAGLQIANSFELTMHQGGGDLNNSGIFLNKNRAPIHDLNALIQKHRLKRKIKKPFRENQIKKFPKE